MNRQDVLNSEPLKKRFLKDCGIPINVTDNPYFFERLAILDGMYDSIHKFNVFCEEMENYATEQEYFEDYVRVKEAMMDRVKSSNGFIEFNEAKEFGKLLASTVDEDYKYPRNDLYKEYNHCGTFISIDMKQANFSALNHYDPTIFEDDMGEESETWEDFIEQFTSNRHFINSKYIRQVVLGNCNPKRQIRYEDYLMQSLAQHIKSTYPSIEFYSVKNDEILIKASELSEEKIGRSLPFNEFKEAIANEQTGIGSMVKVRMFYMYKIEESGWVLDYYTLNGNEKIEFKCMDADTIHQYIKHYYNLPISQNDLVFKHKGKLAQFLEEVNNPWEE